MRQSVVVRALTNVEERELKRLVRGGKNARVVRRAQMIRLAHEGQSAAEIARLWEVSAQGVRKVIHRFNRLGMGGLADQVRQGRPRKTTPHYVQLLQEAVATSPRDLGYPFSCWTLERLREHLGRRTRILLSLTRLAQVMAEHHIVYRRPKHGMNHLRDPQEYDEKKAFLEFVKKGRRRWTPPSTSSTSMSVRFTSTRP
jgi:transposase